MGRKLIIVFYGCDGSGKTTQIRLISRIFRKLGIKFATAKVSTNHLPARLIEKIFVYFGYYVYRPSSLYPLQKRLPLILVRKKLSLQSLFILSNIFSSILAILFLVHFRLLFVDVVLVEDFVPRIIADFVYASGYRISRYFPLFKPLLLLLFRSNTKFIYLAVDSYKTLVKRRGIAVEPYDYIACQKYVYNIIAEHTNSKIINTEHLTIVNTTKVIVKYIKHLLSATLTGHVLGCDHI